MGVSTLIGTADGTSHAAVMYCNTTGWPVGPVFEAADAEDQIDAFQKWLGENPLGEVSASIGRELVQRFRDGRDPRDWSDADLAVLVSYWRGIYVEDGWLADSFSCACGHHHLGPDGEYAREDLDGCVTCSCTEWRPGNRAAEVEAKKEAAADAHV